MPAGVKRRRKNKMKKVVLVFVILAVVAGSTFAQFGIEGGLITDFTGTPMPTVGIAYGLQKMDILGGLTFWYNYISYGYGVSGYDWGMGIYGGVAPKLVTAGPWTLSLPILAFFNFGGTGSFAFQLNLSGGPRAYYALSDKWSLYTGLLLNVFEVGRRNGATRVGIFSGVDLQLGIKHTFGKK
jgi:hypothetical protein